MEWKYTGQGSTYRAKAPQTIVIKQGPPGHTRSQVAKTQGSYKQTSNRHVHTQIAWISEDCCELQLVNESQQMSFGRARVKKFIVDK